MDTRLELVNLTYRTSVLNTGGSDSQLTGWGYCNHGNHGKLNVNFVGAESSRSCPEPSPVMVQRNRDPSQPPACLFRERKLALDLL